jgi:hypothetical protein
MSMRGEIIYECYKEHRMRKQNLPSGFGALLIERFKEETNKVPERSAPSSFL